MALAKTKEDLQWARLEAAVAERGQHPRSEGRSLPFATSLDGSRRALAETREAFELLVAGEPLPLDGIRDIDLSLDRLAREGALDGPGLRDIQRTLGVAGVLRRFLASRRDRSPSLYEACPIDPSLDVLIDELSASIEADGTVSDRASPDLRKLRTETANLRARIVGRLEQLVVKRADLLSDRFHTLREGRYVLPVRADAHERVHGIVHGTSGSGATVFVEPRELIAQGNRLKMAEAEMNREEARILALLSDLVRERLASVRAAYDTLDHADLRYASARFARDFEASFPELSGEPRIELRGARHPILVIDAGRSDGVVPNDLSLEAGQALVLSGPNAGGKTVALKIFGLTSLMVRAGLPVLADEGSACGFFDPILTDVGDEQSLEMNLSTFSAHITNLVAILRGASPGALVLLDEVATGTDPEEGAALACAVVDTLCRRGSAVAVTTHYEALKALAVQDSRLRNASVGFNVEKMEPTFELRMDVPGASSALDVAERFGVPTDVLTLARRILPEQSATFDSLVRQLDSQRQALALQQSRLDEARAGVEARETQAALKEEALRRRDEEKVGEEAKRILGQLRQARGELREAKKALRRRRIDEETAQRIRQKLDSAEKVAMDARPAEEDHASPSGPPPTPGELEIGTEVWVERLKAQATVVERPDDKGRLRIAAGALKVSVRIEEVRLRATDGPEQPGPTAASPDSRDEARSAPAVRTRDNTLDVRGMRVDDAVGMVEAFLDRLYGADEPAAYILHGLGTGALRQALREHLSDYPRYIRRWRAGERDEGGDGVTVAMLR